MASRPDERPSNKGYSPVPAEPLPIEPNMGDGVEADHEAEDGDELYSTNVPLLSGRPHDNEPQQVSNRSRWYRGRFAWKPSNHRDPFTWSSPGKKPRNWRKILFWTIFGFLVTATVAFSISTGILASNLQRCERSKGGYYQPYRPYQQSRLPFNNDHVSANFRLNFPRVYPPLDASASISCQSAWNQLAYVPCHEKIWNRSWDNGKHGLFDPDISTYAPTLCQSRCTERINKAFQDIAWQCTEDDKFDMTDYSGPFSADPRLEEGPLSVMSTIAKRLGHTCRREPDTRYQHSRENFCSAAMWQDWLIVDGMNAGNLRGLDAFEARTATPRVDYSYRMYQGVQDSCDDITSVPYRYPAYAGGRRFGPTPNSTTCGRCTLDWFGRKLLSFEKNAISDPKTGKVVNLKEYLLRIKQAGERCDGAAWDRSWSRALRKYKASGDLPADWNGERKGKGDDGPMKPCPPSEEARRVE